MEKDTFLQDNQKKTKRAKRPRKNSDISLCVILLVAVLIVEITMLFFNRLFFINIFGLLNDILIYFSVILLINFIKNVKARKIVFTVFFSLIAAFFLIDSLYSAFFGGFASVDSLRTVDNLFIKKDVGVRVPIATIVIALETLVGIFFIWKIKIYKVRDGNFYRYATAIFLATVIGIGSANMAVVASNRNKEYTSKIEYYASNSFLYDYFYNSYKYTTTFGYINYRIRDFSYSDNSNILLADIADFYKDIEDVPRNTDISGIFEGYNLITVLCETFDTRIVSKELMPNFAKSMESSLIFENYYVPTFFEATTINSEYMSLSGRFPASAKAWVSSMGDQYKHNDFSDFTTPSQLKKNGYNTYYLHEGYRFFYSRGTLMPNMGFDESYFIDNLGYTSKFLDPELIDLMDNINFDEKFYASMLTYSMHMGNDGDFISKGSGAYGHYDFVKNKYPNANKATLVYYTKARVFDDFVGGLFDKLESEGVIDNTIVLFYPDHYAYGNKSLTNDLGLNTDNKEIHHQILTMYMPNDARAELLDRIQHTQYKDFDHARATQVLGATIDLPPTLLNLFTTDAEYKYFAGQDMLASDIYFEGRTENFVFFSDYTVFDGKVFYDLEKNLYSLTGISKSEMQQRLPALNKKLEEYIEVTLMHRIMLDIDYFRKIKE